MAKAVAPSYECIGCHTKSSGWVGRCHGCGEYGTVQELTAAADAVSTVGLRGTTSGVAPSRAARPVRDLSAETVARTTSGLTELDRVLGGGLVAGQVILLAGEPGVGKSTLLLDAANRYSAGEGGGPRTVLYISGEESAEQIAVRARRIGADGEGLMIADETDLQSVLGHVEAINPSLLVVDSVQTIASASVDSRAGGIAQVHEVTQTITRVAKARRMPVFLIGQSTRDNAVAGPRALEHLVDTVLTFEGDRTTALRLLRATKNRYGPADEVVCFEQAEDGLREVGDPSQLFRAERDVPVPGTCLTVTIEGRRALLAEVQALVAPTGAVNPRRGVTGLDGARVAMLVAVTERAARLRIYEKDVYVATVAGMRLSDPAADLPVCLAVASAEWGTPLPPDIVAIGEVALSGDIRPVGGLAQRVAEAARLGFHRVLVPPGGRAQLPRSASDRAPAGVSVIEVAHVSRALTALRLQVKRD